MKEIKKCDCDRCHDLETILKAIQDRMLPHTTIWDMIQEVLDKK